MIMSKSKIVATIGAVVTVIAVILPVFGIEVTAEQQSSFAAGLAAIIGVILSVVGKNPLEKE